MVLAKFLGARNALSRGIGGATYKQARLYIFMFQTRQFFAILLHNTCEPWDEAIFAPRAIF